MAIACFSGAWDIFKLFLPSLICKSSALASIELMVIPGAGSKYTLVTIGPASTPVIRPSIEKDFSTSRILGLKVSSILALNSTCSNFSGFAIETSSSKFDIDAVLGLKSNQFVFRNVIWALNTAKIYFFVLLSPELFRVCVTC